MTFGTLPTSPIAITQSNYVISMQTALATGSGSFTVTYVDFAGNTKVNTIVANVVWARVEGYTYEAWGTPFPRYNYPAAN